MPYPAKVDRETVIQTAWELVAAHNFDTLTMTDIAKAVNVKAASLYRHIESKADLLRGINTVTEKRLFEAMNKALSDASPQEQLAAMARAYRQFAHAHPVQFMLAYNTLFDAATSQPVADSLEAVQVFQALIAHISGEADSLAALRGLLALIHGFVVLELNNRLRRGGDLNEAFEKSLAAYLNGWP